MYCDCCGTEQHVCYTADFRGSDERYHIPYEYQRICIKCANRFLRIKCNCPTLKDLGFEEIKVGVDIWLNNGDVLPVEGYAFVEKLAKNSYHIKMQDSSGKWFLNVISKSDTVVGEGARKYRVVVSEVIDRYEKSLSK